MKKIYLISILLITLMCAICTGCSQNISPNAYSTDEIGTVNRVAQATIASMRSIKINNSSDVGGLAGTAAGAAAGSSIGGGDHANIVGAIGGAIVGGVAGEAIDKTIHKQHGIEYVLKLKKSGKLVSIIQQGHNLNLHVGQHVLVIYGKRTHIVPDASV